MFRQLTALILLVAFTAQTYNAAFVLVNFYTNNAAYVKACINKATPAMHCNGNCQLMKQLREAEKKEQQNEEQKLEVFSPMLCTAAIESPLTIAAAIKIKTVIYDINYNIKSSSVDVFHPPQLNAAA